MAQPQLSLQPRLQAIAGLVPQGGRLADVGTDHAYLPISLLLGEKIPGAIATDIHPEPLERGRRTARAFGVEERISFRLCDGLSAVSAEEVDTVVIAGMGGETIAAILDAVPWSREKRVLLQPMSRAEFLRPWLAGHGWRVLGETLVRDKGHIYPILELSGGEMEPLAPGARYYGFSDPAGPLFSEYLGGWKNRLQRAAEGLRQTEDPGQRLADLERELEALMEKERML